MLLKDIIIILCNNPKGKLDYENVKKKYTSTDPDIMYYIFRSLKWIGLLLRRYQDIR